MISHVIKPQVGWRSHDADAELFTPMFRFGYHEGMHKKHHGKTKDKWEKFVSDLFATQDGFIGKRPFKQVGDSADTSVTDADTSSNTILSAVKSTGTTDFIKRLIDGVTGGTPNSSITPLASSNEEIIANFAQHHCEFCTTRSRWCADNLSKAPGSLQAQ